MSNSISLHQESNQAQMSPRNRRWLQTWLYKQWLFFNILQMPFKWFRWLYLVALIVFAIGAGVSLAHKEWNWEFTQHYWGVFAAMAGVGGGILALAIMLALFILPSNLVHLVTSKQFLLLKNIKYDLWQHLLVVASIYSVMICLAFSKGFSNQYFSMQLFLLSLFLWSSFFHIAVFITQKSMAWAFMIGFLVPIYQFIAFHLKAIDPIILAALSITTWVIFSFWWFKWRPTEHRFAVMTDSISDPTKLQRIQGGVGQGIFSFLQFGLNKNIENLFDGFLLGRSKAPLKVIYLALSIPVLIGGSVFLSMSLLPFASVQSTINGLSSMSAMYILFLITQPGFQSLNILNNIKKSWLIHLGTRQEFFTRVESLILSQVIIQALASAVLILCLLWFFDASTVKWTSSLLAIGLGIIDSFLLIYLFLLCYRLTNASRAATTIISMVIALIILVPLGLAISFKEKNLFADYLGSIVALCSFLSILTITLRFYTRRAWKKIDFLRMH